MVNDRDINNTDQDRVVVSIRIIAINVNKKLRYREEHSASVFLVRVLYDISREKIC